jgi:hypothetical protein
MQVPQGGDRCRTVAVKCTPENASPCKCISLKLSRKFAMSKILTPITIAVAFGLLVAAAAAAPAKAYAAETRDQALWDAKSAMVFYRKCVGDLEHHLDADYYYCKMLNGN